MHQSLIQYLDCRFAAVEFPLFKENDFIHENLRTKIGILFRYINNIPI